MPSTNPPTGIGEPGFRHRHRRWPTLIRVSRRLGSPPCPCSRNLHVRTLSAMNELQSSFWNGGALGRVRTRPSSPRWSTSRVVLPQARRPNAASPMAAGRDHQRRMPRGRCRPQGRVVDPRGGSVWYAPSTIQRPTWRGSSDCRATGSSPSCWNGSPPHRSGNPSSSSGHQASETPCAIATVIPHGREAPENRGPFVLGRQGEAGGSLSGSLTPLRRWPTRCASPGREKPGRLVHSPEAMSSSNGSGLPQRLIVFGGGLDVVPSSRFAGILGWRVTVVDAHSGPASSAASRAWARGSPARRGGLVVAGNRRTVGGRSDDPTAHGIAPTSASSSVTPLPGCSDPTTGGNFLFRGRDQPATTDVHAPVGLDLGADHPETIALSIICGNSIPCLVAEPRDPSEPPRFPPCSREGAGPGRLCRPTTKRPP